MLPPATNVEVLFDRNISDGRAMIVSFLTLAIGNNQGMVDVEYAKMHDFYVPPDYPELIEGPPSVAVPTCA